MRNLLYFFLQFGMEIINLLFHKSVSVPPILLLIDETEMKEAITDPGELKEYLGYMNHFQPPANHVETNM